MIQVEKLSYGFPEKDLYHDISFSIEQGQHCALIGSNGCGKSTLVEMLTDPEKYWFDGKITKDEECRTGYAGQFCVREKTQDCTVFEYLSRRFTDLQDEIAKVCEVMAHPENNEADMERLFSQYQALLDRNEAMDGDNYENAIRRQLNAAGMGALEDTRLSDISGGEYKLLQIMKEMLLAPNFLVLDEPDVFLDFENLNGLCRLINGFKGTILAVTHNRYLLNQCFDKILHLENGDLQEFDGTYSEYRCRLLREKIELKLQHIEEQEEIARTEEMVEILRKRATLMVNPTIGQAVNAKPEIAILFPHVFVIVLLKIGNKEAAVRGENAPYFGQCLPGILQVVQDKVDAGKICFLIAQRQVFQFPYAQGNSLSCPGKAGQVLAAGLDHA